MENLRDYLSDYLKEMQKYYDEQVSAYKKVLNGELNQFLQELIKFAEGKIEEAKKDYTEKYNQQMKKIEERKSGSNPDHFLLERDEKYTKKSFEDNLKFSIDIWINFIEDCRKKIIT